VREHRQLHQAKGKLWEAFTADERVVLLIDEIDKADIEFPNDLLQELDRMEFHVYETGETIVAPTSADRRHHLQQREGAAGRLPAPLLLPLHRFPDRETMQRIVDVHFPDMRRSWSARRWRCSSTCARCPG
jgi:MoxR-like ATPase